jgi:hypothetical protein
MPRRWSLSVNIRSVSPLNMQAQTAFRSMSVSAPDTISSGSAPRYTSMSGASNPVPQHPTKPARNGRSPASDQTPQATRSHRGQRTVRHWCRLGTHDARVLERERVGQRGRSAMRLDIVFPQTELAGYVGAVRTYGQAAEALGQTRLRA